MTVSVALSPPVSEAPARPISGSAWAVVVVLVCIACCNLYLLLAISIGPHSHWIGGWFVTDGVTLWEAALEDRHLSTFDLLNSYPAGAALAVINAWGASLSAASPAVLNIALLAVIVFDCTKVNRSWVVLPILLIPYYLVSTPLPSKDILVAVLFLICTNFFVREGLWNKLGAIAVAAIMYFVRDGYAVMLAISLLLILAAEYLHLNARSLLIACVGGAACFWLVFELILADAFLVVRAVGVAEQGQTLDAGNLRGPDGYFIRLFGNATNLAFRPVFTDILGRFDVLSVAYATSGLTLACGLLACVQGITSKTQLERRLGQLGVLSWIWISVTPYVQPRYLLPICLLLPAFSFVNGRWMLTRMVTVAALAGIATTLYSTLGSYPPPAQPVSFVWGDKP